MKMIKENIVKTLEKILLLSLVLALIPQHIMRAEETAVVSTQPLSSAFPIRAAFWGFTAIDQKEKQFHLLQTHGFNTALVNDGNFQLAPSVWKAWGETARKYQIHLFPVLNFAGPNEIHSLQGTYRAYRDRDGNILSSTPCPLDATYWYHAIAERFFLLSALAKPTDFSGLLFDTEMYGSEISLYRDPCFCDDCWQEFVHTLPFSTQKQEPLLVNLDPSTRLQYLVKHHLLQHYVDMQTHSLKSILQRIEREIHRMHPDLLLGFLAYQKTWFYNGLIRGLGVSDTPVLVFSETSYARGYTRKVDQESTFIKETSRKDQTTTDSALSVRYIPGLWLGRFFPQDLPQQIYQLATHTQGYWIFTAASLWDEEVKREPYTLHGEPNYYWNALKKANIALKKCFGSFKSNCLPFYEVAPSSWYETNSDKLLKPVSFQNFVRDILPQHNNLLVDHEHDEILCLGKTLIHGIKKTPGQGTIHLHRPFDRASERQPYYTVFDHGGNVIQKGSIKPQNQPDIIELSISVSDNFSLLIVPENVPIKASFSNISFFLEASATFPLTLIPDQSTYRLYANPSSKYIKLKAYSPGKNPTGMTVTSPDGDVFLKTPVVEFSEFHILHENRDVLTLSLSPTTLTSSPVLVYFYDEKFPYLFPHKRQ